MFDLTASCSCRLAPYFERVADRSPVILVFEDLQWADPALLDFVEHLAAWTRDHPILVLALARPELLDLRPTWAAGIGRTTTLHLEPLSDASMRELLLDRVPTLAEPTVSAILERAGGVPLYAVEVAASWAGPASAASFRRMASGARSPARHTNGRPRASTSRNRFTD